jgi:phage tail P2-like protein
MGVIFDPRIFDARIFHNPVVQAVATAFATGAPVFGTPVATHRVALPVATAFAVAGPPVFGAPTVTVFNALHAASLVVRSPVFGTPFAEFGGEKPDIVAGAGGIYGFADGAIVDPQPVIAGDGGIFAYATGNIIEAADVVRGIGVAYVVAMGGAELLYRAATGLEQSMADVDAERVTRIDAELIIDNWDPYKVATSNLGYLAYAMGVTLWEDDYWTEGTKRTWVANQWTFKSLRGTIAGVRMVLQVSGYQLVAYVAPPQGFYASADLEPAVFNAWLRLMPELRLFYAHRESTRGLDEFFCDWGCADQDAVSIDDGFALRGRYAVLRHLGVDTPVQMFRVERALDDDAAVVDFERVCLPGKSSLGIVTDEDACGEDRFCCFEEIVPKIYTLRLDRTFSVDASRVVMSSTQSSLDPITPTFETNSDVGFGDGMVFAGDHSDDRYADQPDGGGFLLADRIYLHDPVVAAPMTAGMSFADADRVGMPVQTVELMVDLMTHEKAPAMFAYALYAEEDYAVPEDDEHIDRALRSIVAAKAMRDTALVSFEPLRQIAIGDPLTAATKYGWIRAVL